MINWNRHTDAILQVENLSLSIGGETKVSDISFTLFAGERVCLLGASGSGKSLTAKAVIGTPPSGCQISGSIRVNGEAVSQLKALARPQASRVSAVFQDSATALNPLMPLGKQLSLALKTTSSSELSALLAAMKLDDIPNLLQRYPAELSGGQRQRICITLALLGKTRLLVADEPTTALDVITQKQVLQVLQERSAQPDAPALLFITHDIAVAAQLCQRGLVMENGRVIESGSMQQLLNAPQQPYTRSLVAAARRTDTLLSDNLFPDNVLPTAVAGALAG
ncbi:ATP-binding cassette domain-containing protein [Pectobacterium versatile]|uniref:ATP-binding cassette domain-containing protein n=1 Tax=Pectobacterium versatile TaxID=2488639 RepID=UPI000B7BB8F1|nr:MULTISPECIES: ABC transporter ATP-binding protein [Pectobacterium]ASN85049.1 Peptide/nickel ABC transporter ATP-binding protein [Pectobacterium versatile]MBA0162420.1 ABC transporter ATP-binding protein [Pectobacterium versatile]MBA0170170.1 ABC transporter ATP-binding protein [Pectobacterium versatile]MBK4825479.1 Oligopeptide transport ATP-binding protein [Pectobacterium carotovorum subsp. carotovorum]MCA6916620.1 ABC transporter ATP-binding protein [Pectobacterium versatile]